MANDAHDDFTSRSGAQLYALLPQLYRAQDGSDNDGGRDLARYLDAFGELLDGLRDLLDQQLADAFPDARPSVDASRDRPLAQDWVLPYLGALVGARPESIDVEGQRAEVASTVRWRQRKGTLQTTVELTEAIGRVSAVVEEGWQRLALTARLDAPRQRPVTLDLRHSSHAVESDITKSSAEYEYTRFAGRELAWSIADPTGAPRFPDSYQDASLRLVDTREPCPERRRGIYHPRRLLVWVAPERSLFPLPTLALNWAEFERSTLRLDSGGSWFVNGYAGDLVITDATLEFGGATQIQGLRFAGEVRVTSGRLEARQSHFEKLELDAGTQLDARDCLIRQLCADGATVVLENCTVRGPTRCGSLDAIECVFSEPPFPPDYGHRSSCCEGTAEAPIKFLIEHPNDDAQRAAAAVLDPENPDAVFPADGERGRYRRGRPFAVLIPDAVELGTLAGRRELADLVFTEPVGLVGGTLQLRRVAAQRLVLRGPTAELDAKSCIFAELDATPEHSLTLEYCTVMQMRFEAGPAFQASDCMIVADARSSDQPPAPAQPNVRWSSLPRTHALDQHCCHGRPRFLSTEFGDRLYGLLSPTSSIDVRSGAEDGGELGAYHDMHWLHQLAGVERKLRDFLPIGITPVLLLDPLMISAIPERNTP